MAIARLALVAALVALAGCAADGQKTARPAPAPATPIPGATVENCVQLQSIRETKVIDDRTIDFYLRDGRVLRNNLPRSCPQLGFERAFSYATSINQLCSVDIITVVVQSGGIRRGASCGLGKFSPIEKPAK